MQLQKAKRTQARIRLCLQGPSGSGKTYSALLVSFGLCANWTRVAVIDTEHGSASLYNQLGEYNVLTLGEPFSPEKYIEALLLCQDAGMEVIVIDGISFEWEYLLDYHANLTGNSFTNWSKVTPRHNRFVQSILQSPCHVIATARTKQDYVLTDKNGKMVPEKVGLKTIQRDGMDYEFTLVFDLDMKNQAVASKDRTSLFQGKPEQKLSVETGKQILAWCQSAEAAESEPIIAILEDEAIQQQVSQCTSLNELTQIFHRCTNEQKKTLLNLFQQQKQFIIQSSLLTNQLLNQTLNQNGNNNPQPD
ncbi:AAA family ATPase [Adhaeribacter rhizoryzae]|uniref:AAA family ATPase n=1 Tax=Adhaeribacter rhizoryzae TaxID=2607907 RepID=A0A5M6DSI8_9BACT|nr:AAA family ATPase [Adhaeribacter rhizoryzae]KAA5548375.1 AAA family ATPase [Adhaeribacter rhizoryzae]